MTSYEVITDQIIKKMEEGTIPWIKPWHANAEGWECENMNGLFPAYSYSNGKRYNFINQMILDFQPGEYATFDQVKKAGGKVKKGEKAQIVCGWIVEDKVQKDKDGKDILDDDGEPVKKKTFALRYYRVFNILTQVEGIKPKHNWTFRTTETKALEPVKEAEKIIADYINSKDAPKFEPREGDKAYYSPACDLVVVPLMSQYDNTDEYYSTAFHELTHSTMKETRCNRREAGKKVAFGEEDYSREELVAEIGSCFLSHTAGISSEDSFRNSVGYLQNWLQALKNDPKMIVMASTQAEKATEYILNA